MNIKNKIYALLAAVVFLACDRAADVDFAKDEATGSLDVSNFIAVGNSLTSGFSNGGLNAYSQSASFPKLIADQFAQYGGTGFSQQEVSAAGSGDIMYIEEFAEGSPVIKNTALNASFFAEKVASDVSNFGIPGMRSIDVTSPHSVYGKANPYFGRLNLDASKSYMDWVAEKEATVFSLWLGSGDVLGFAATGGMFGEAGNQRIPGAYEDGLSPLNAFALSYNAVFDMLAAKNNGQAKGVVGTVPSITSAPYFTFVNTQLAAMAGQIPAFNAQTAAFVNFVYQLAGYILPEGGLFKEGVNFPAIVKGHEYNTIDAENGVFDRKPAGELSVELFNAAEGDLALLTFAGIQSRILTEGLGYIKQTAETAELQALAVEALPKIAQAEALGAQAQALKDEALRLGEEAALLKAEAVELAQQAAALLAEGKTEEAAAKQAQAELKGAQALQKATSAAEKGAQALEKKIQLDALVSQIAALLYTPENIAKALNVAHPVSSQYVLDSEEVALVSERIGQMNAVITAKVDQNPNTVLFNSSELLSKLNTDGIQMNGIGLTGAYVSGGVFSLDGIHLTPRGYGLVANKLITLLNGKFNASIATADLSKLDPVLFP
ncbi:MAG: hypothetical protein MI784_03175 [Cytophagales bacterium]|nr:hypothetical protein [Cytophagales bacterium]